MAFPFLAAIPVVGKIIEKVLGVVDQAVEDKDQKARLQAEIQTAVLGMNHAEFMQEIQSKAGIIMAEAKGQSWIQRTWRPILMMVFVAIVANNYLVYPYLRIWFPEHVVLLHLPDHMWNLMNIGVGGYIVGRSGEKIVSKWKAKNAE